MAVKPIPDGYHTVTPYLVVPDVARLIEFLEQALGAKEIERMPMPDGSVTHAEVRIGDSPVMMGQASGQHKPLPCALYVYVADVDAAYRQAIAAGATSISAPADMFYGDRNAGVLDPAGNQWWMATHKEDVPPAEMRRRAIARAAQQSGQ